MKTERPNRGLLALLFPEPPRALPGLTRLELPLRIVHIAAMALVLGATPYVSDRRSLRFAILPMVFSGLAMLGIELARSCAFLLQLRGALTMLKFALITLGALFPASRFAFSLAAPALAAAGAHLPERLRLRRFWGQLDLTSRSAEAAAS
jgi:hypothetical protein